MAKKAKNYGEKKKIQFEGIKQNFRKKKKNTTEIVSTENGKKKRRSKKTRNRILIVLMVFLIACALSCLSFCVYIIATCPEFDTSRLYKSGSTTIYDSEMNVIAELGVEKRENVTYDALPEVLIDAIVATEDSRFFMHDGIDLLRFGKAAIGQLIGQAGAGGGSTLTMQIVKNTYNGSEASGIAGILRKFRDIYMAVFKVEKTYTKQEILEFYVNQGTLGSGAGGVEQASQVYFGKSVGELNLPEAALIAGLFQAPSAYNPYIYPDKAEARRNQVLGLMLRHGYISEEEEKIAKSVKVQDMLAGYNFSYSEWQGFIDTVVAQVIKETDKDPYSVSMKIYTTLRQDKQKVINDLYAGKIFPNVTTKKYKWKNDIVQCSVAVTDVDTGAIVAVGSGRNKSGERQLNLATSIKRHPGSTAKPIFDYGPAIEYAGWGTGTTVVDDQYTYSDGTPFNNVEGSYYGIMTAKSALAQSRNIPALQAFQATTQKQKYDFVTGLGITPELSKGTNEIMESASLGAFDGVNPMELSAAYGTFARGGYYIEPYSFTKIEFENGDTYIHPVTKTKVMSEETAYMVNMILKYAVTSGKIGVGYVSGTDLASKTGTASIPYSVIKSMGLSENAIKDIFQVSYSPDYSIAFWYGYETLTKEYYLTSGEGWDARKEIVRALTPRIMEKNSRWSKPKGVTTVEIELETNPVQLASEFTPAKLKSTEYFRKGTEPTEVSKRFSQLDNVTNLTYTTIGNQIQLSWSPIDTPDAIDQGYLESYFNTNYSRWAEKYLNKRLEYNSANIGTLVYEVFRLNSDGTLYSLGTTSNTTFTTTLSSTSDTFVVKSAYSIFKDNASSGANITVKMNPSFDPSTPDDTDTEEGEENTNE